MFGAVTRSTRMPKHTITKAASVTDGDQLAQNIQRHGGRKQRSERAGDDGAKPGRAEARMNFPEHCKEQTVIRHRVKNPRLPEQQNEYD